MLMTIILAANLAINAPVIHVAPIAPNFGVALTVREVSNVIGPLMGLHENRPADRQKLREFFKKHMGRDIDPAKVPWCAAFVNSVLGALHVRGTDSLRARSFLKWGRATTKPKIGDIVVLSRGMNPSLGHVGFYIGLTARGNIKILGGNQSNSVRISVYKASRLLSYRTLS